MKRIKAISFFLSCILTVLAIEQPYTSIAEQIMKYGNTPYAENLFNKLGIPLSSDLGDNQYSSVFEGIDMNGKHLTIKLQHGQAPQDLDYLAFIVDICYYESIVQNLLSNGYVITKNDRSDNYGYGTIAKQKIFNSDNAMCVVQTGNSYLEGKVYLYYTSRFANNNIIKKSPSDIEIMDLNVIFDPNNESETDWNSTEIEPDWLVNAGIYLDSQHGIFYELKPFYDLRTSNIAPIDGILNNPANVKQAAVSNALEPIRRINKAKTQLLEVTNSIEYVQPQFPGGDEALWKYIQSNFKMPKSFESERGRVVATFDIDERGKVINAKIYRSFSPDVDKEFIRVIQSLPDFIPGTANGKPYKFTGYKIPLNLRAQ